MNKKFLKHYMETEPEGTSKKYIFLVDNQDIAMNIVMSGYQALYLGQEDDGYYFSVNSFIEDMRSIQFHGTCQSAYHYVAACTTKWMNDRILEFCKEAGLDGKAGWQLFKEKEYLVILHFIYSQNHSTHVKFNKAPASNKVTYIPSDSLIPEPFMLPLSRTNEKRQASTVQSRPVFPHTAPGVKLPCALTSI